MANTHEHLEHAEHAQHHAADPFNMRVAVTMAIVAACLAGISMVGHRTHNKVLQLMGEANRLRTEAATAEVEKSNLFAWYQSKRLRQAQFEIAAETVALMPGADDARKKAVAGWKGKVEEYKVPNKEHDSLPELQDRGKAAGKKAESLTAQAVKVRDEAEHIHHQADRLDIAHLVAEVALVICSIALLTKKKAFWHLGMVLAVSALITTASAYMIPHHPHPHAEGDSHGHPH
ncbi:MAG TPA: DUF4337 family protein [Gemmataceae bacterium]|nr:DUF4337 family protein [Gemmataceae bacterium]